MKSLFSIVSVALLASAFASASCKKDEKKKDEPAATKPAEGASTVPVAGDVKPADPVATEPTATLAAAQDPAALAAGAPVKQPTDEEKALAEKAVTMLEEMSAAAEANPADCGKAAGAMQGIVDKNKDLIAQGKAMDKDPGKKAWFEQTYQDRIMGAMGKMVPLMEKCKDDPALLKVLTALQ